MNEESNAKFYAKMIGGGIAALILLVAIVMGTIAGFKAFNRYQRVADAKNQQRVIEMQVKQTANLVLVEQQKAAVRIAEAEGIAESQRIIDSSLTEDYLTYLAIQAQMAAVDSPNNTVIYIPVSNNGIPIVRDVSEDGQP